MEVLRFGCRGEEVDPQVPYFFLRVSLEDYEEELVAEFDLETVLFVNYLKFQAFSNWGLASIGLNG